MQVGNAPDGEDAYAAQSFLHDTGITACLAMNVAYLCLSD
jgi:hypothetical protein